MEHPPAPPRLPPRIAQAPSSLQRQWKLGEPCTLVFWSCKRGAPRPREPFSGFPSAAPLCGLSQPPPPAARPQSLPPAQPAGARTPGLRHVGAREAAAAAAAAGAQAPACELALHAAGCAAAFCSASGPSPAGRAGEAAEGRGTQPGGGARRARASRALSKGRPQPGGGSPALSLSLCSSHCRGFQAVRCLSSPRRQPAEASRSSSAHSSPHSSGESLVYPDAPSHWSPSERKVRSPPPAPPTSPGAPLPAAACASLGSDAPPAGRCSLCQLATHGIDCPGLPCLERVALAAWPGRGARHPRRFVDPACVNLLGSPAGAASVPKGE